MAGPVLGTGGTAGLAPWAKTPETEISKKAETTATILQFMTRGPSYGGQKALFCGLSRKLKLKPSHLAIQNDNQA
jgi:hypothetical protein